MCVVITLCCEYLLFNILQGSVTSSDQYLMKLLIYETWWLLFIGPPCSSHAAVGEGQTLHAKNYSWRRIYTGKYSRWGRLLGGDTVIVIH